jgi:uncharacterized protein (DUF2062 family)
MLFRSRRTATLWDRFRLWLWPRVSWRRSALYYLKRTLRLSGTPYAIAMGTAIGAFVSCSPFFGFHLILTLILSWLMGANVIAGAIGSVFGNPVTYPFLWAADYEIGQIMLGRASNTAPPRLEHDLLHKSWEQLWPLLKPMSIGCIPIGLAVGAIIYVLVYKAVSAYRDQRRLRFARRQAGSGTEPDGVGTLKSESGQ